MQDKRLEDQPVQHDELSDYPTDAPDKKRRYFYAGWNVAYQGTFGGFIWMARFLNAKVKFYMASASIPVEVANFLIVMKKLVGREKPLIIFFSVVLPLIAMITTMVLVDLVRFGVITGGGLAVIAANASYIFATALAIFAILNGVRAFEALRECIAASKNGTLTASHKIRLASRVTKTLALAALACMMPFFMAATLTNPFGAILYAAAITAVLTTVVVMKIWKTRQETKAWTKTIGDILEKNEDPYETLGIDQDELNKYIEDKRTVTGFTKLKNMFSAIKTTLLGTEEEKEALKKKHTPSSYVKECLEKAIEGKDKIKDAAEIAKLSRYAELIRKARGREVLHRHQWPQIIQELNGLGTDPYLFLGITAQDRQNWLALEKPVGRVKRFFGLVPEIEAINSAIHKKYEEYILQAQRTPEQLKLAKRVLNMLMVREGREKYEEYENKKVKPVEHTRALQEDSEEALLDAALQAKAYGNPLAGPRSSNLPAASHPSQAVFVAGH